MLFPFSQVKKLELFLPLSPEMLPDDSNYPGTGQLSALLFIPIH